MSAIHVGIGECSISSDQGDVIRTFALGSCVALIGHDRYGKIAGIMHIALPDSSINAGRAQKHPGYFVDTGVPHLLRLLKEASATKTGLTFKITGGSSIMDPRRRFDIGKRNVLAIRKLMWKFGLGITAEDVGGSKSRTVTVAVDSGEVLISSGGTEWQL